MTTPSRSRSRSQLLLLLLLVHPLPLSEAQSGSAELETVETLGPSSQVEEQEEGPEGKQQHSSYGRGNSQYIPSIYTLKSQFIMSSAALQHSVAHFRCKL